MQSALEIFITTSVLAYMLTFTRLGTAALIMPGIGDAFVSTRVRLHFVAALTFAMFPLTMAFIPDPLPSAMGLIALVFMEFIIGLFIGTIARILISALDTAGMVISISSGFGNAQVFNPSLASQGSLIGALLSVTGAVLIFQVNLHHLLFMGIFESYTFFPLGALPDFGSMAELMAQTVAASFAIGVKIAAPFIVLTLLIYSGIGVLTRLMPQVQVFILALPLQILLSLILLMLVFSSAMMYWLAQFEEGMVFFLTTTQ